MSITVNATEAARLVGVSERTVRAWLTAGKIRGAEVRQTPGKGPASWAIDTDALASLEGVTLDNDALQALEAERAGVSATILARLAALEATLEALRQRSPYLFMPVARSEPNLTEQASEDMRAPRRPASAATVRRLAPGEFPASANGRGKWIEAHGGPGVAWVRSWADVASWRGPEDAIAAVRRRQHWHDWQPRECADPACECHALLGAGAGVPVGIEVREHE